MPPQIPRLTIYHGNASEDAEIVSRSFEVFARSRELLEEKIPRTIVLGDSQQLDATSINPEENSG